MLCRLFSYHRISLRKRLVYNELTGDDDEYVNDNEDICRGSGGGFLVSGATRHHHAWADHSDLGSGPSIPPGRGILPPPSVKRTNPIDSIKDSKYRKSIRTVIITVIAIR